jgi:hypothetical protein
MCLKYRTQMVEACAHSIHASSPHTHAHTHAYTYTYTYLQPEAFFEVSQPDGRGAEIVGTPGDVLVAWGSSIATSSNPALCVCVFVYACMCIYVYVCVCVYIYIYMIVDTPGDYVYMHVCVCVFV